MNFKVVVAVLIKGWARLDGLWMVVFTLQIRMIGPEKKVVHLVEIFGIGQS